MDTAERSISALEYIVHDLLALMLRANDDGFNPQEVLTAIDFVVRQAHLVLNEDNGSCEPANSAVRNLYSLDTKIVH